MKIYIMNKQEDFEQVEQSIEMNWDPEDAKKLGSLKGIAEFKVDAEHTKLAIEFTEPKKKKNLRTTPKVVTLKRNKGGLF
jgi:hypothetical protein